MNTARLTVRLPPKELGFAKKYAKENGISLTALVLRYFKRLEQSETQDMPPEVESIAGIIPQNSPAKDDYMTYMEKKHR
jgi:hypothetical protein